ncbi:MAG TPA: PRC-barrel domain-containing protein [Stellaceae bacterium]|nr:PRC-barrel domain-containing protein [Stellaceae bacterium]
MHKSAPIALAILLGAAPLAYAQTMSQPAPASSQPSHATSATFTTQSGELRASKLIGSSVYDVQNQDIGSVKDIILDKSGRVAGVVVDVGTFLGMGGKYVSVSLNDMKMNNDRITLDRTKDQLKSAPAYQLSSNKS